MSKKISDSNNIKFYLSQQNKNLTTFLKHVFQILYPNNKYIDTWHVYEIINILQLILSNEEYNKSAVSIPPRLMKSVIISVVLPCFLISINPTSKIIIATYSISIAKKMIIDIQKIVTSKWFENCFPLVRVNKVVNSGSKIILASGGFFMGTSVGGSITGEGADILILDDPHKPIEIVRANKREKVYDWFENTFLSRLNDKKNGKVFIIMQRLHSDDLIGRIKKNNKTGEWRFFSFPVLSFINMELLNPRRGLLCNVFKMQKEFDSLTFNSQYLQEPSELKSGFIKQYWLCMATEKIMQEQYGQLTYYYLSVDSAFKAGENNDYTAMSIIKVFKHESIFYYFIDDVVRIKCEYPALVAKILELNNKAAMNNNTKGFDGIIIEEKASGISLVQSLKTEHKMRNIIAFATGYSKETRLSLSVYLFEDGRIFFNPNMQNCKILLQELLSFPYGENDDMVDSISNFLMWFNVLKNNKKGGGVVTKNNTPYLRLI